MIFTNGELISIMWMVVVFIVSIIVSGGIRDIATSIQGLEYDD